jgi:CDP-glycerol glycerophosphotransferase (TagB/SpsB family)
MLITFPLLFLDHLISSEAFKKHPNSLLLVFSDAPPGYKALVHTARRWGVKSLTIQHGILGIVLQHKESKASSLFSAFHTDYYASWGTRTIEIYSSFDASMKDKIHVTGSPRYDTFRNPKIYDRHEVLDKYRLPDKKIVLIAPGWQQDITVSSSDFEDMKMIEAVLEAQMAPELEGKVHVVVKPHPSGDSMLLNEFCGQMAEIYPDLSVVRGDINELISVADICVGSLTTVILEAMFFKKPSISFLHPLKKQSVPYVSWGAALSASNSQEMADAIESLLFDNEVLKSIINKQESFIEYAAYKIDGGATERVSNLIEQIMDGKKPSVYM